MKEETFENVRPRIPEAVNGFQINFCKNPQCMNFGVPASTKKQPRGPGAQAKERDSYTIEVQSKGYPRLKCDRCNEKPPLKSNQGIMEELERLSAYLKLPPEVSCPTEQCPNHHHGVLSHPDRYYPHGETKALSRRYRCKACRKTFVAATRPTRWQQKSHVNKKIFLNLVNRTPLARICEVTGISRGTLYSKIDFIHGKCLEFIADKERRLLEGMSIPRLYVSVDRQVYWTNWIKDDDRRNARFESVGSSDKRSGYVFGMHVNFEHRLHPFVVAAESQFNFDSELPKPFRKFARLWVGKDYEDAVQKPQRKEYLSGKGVLLANVNAGYIEMTAREDVEDCESHNKNTRLPNKGLQVHAEYTLYAHFLLLKRLFRGVEKVRFFLDQESAIRAACLGAFHEEILERRCDALFVKINKDMTNDQRGSIMRENLRKIRELREQSPYDVLADEELRWILIMRAMKDVEPMGPWKDAWYVHPLPRKEEPEKAVCHLTNFNDYDDEHMAHLYDMASLHSIDNYFQLVRRRLNPLERPVSSASNQGRVWNGYSPYDPAMIQKLNDIFRVYYNYVLAGKDKKTPAMRLGLAKGKVRLDDILYFRGNDMLKKTAN